MPETVLPQRLAKVIAERGVCSRRAASRLIEQNRVQVNHRPARHIDHVTEHDIISIDGQPLAAQTANHYWLYHKPAGIDCNLSQDNPVSLYHCLQQLPSRVYPVGRLDKDSRGLLLLTNDGQLAQQLLHPDYQHQKEYLVTTDKALTPIVLQQLSQGVSWRVGPHCYQSRPCEVQQTAEYQFSIILTEGQNRQIRYMCRAVGYKVLDLCRIRIENLWLNELEPDQIIAVSPSQLSQLKTRLGLAQT